MLKEIIKEIIMSFTRMTLTEEDPTTGLPVDETTVDMIDPNPYIDDHQTMGVSADEE